MPIPFSICKKVRTNRRYTETQTKDIINSIQQALKANDFEVNLLENNSLEYVKSSYAFFRRNFSDLIGGGKIKIINNNDGAVIEVKIFFSFVPISFFVFLVAISGSIMFLPQLAFFNLFIQNAIVAVFILAFGSIVCFAYPSFEMKRLIIHRS